MRVRKFKWRMAFVDRPWEIALGLGRGKIVPLVEEFVGTRDVPAFGVDDNGFERGDGKSAVNISILGLS